MYTPIHRALDLEPGDLTYEMLEHAVQQGIRESEDLDWKQVPPPQAGKPWQEEFAKDVAAMANSGGGWIVYGVEDSRTTSAAVRLHPFSAVDDGLERQLRGSAHSRVQPPVRGVRFYPVTKPGSSTEGVLAMQVLPSGDVPHLLPVHDGFRAPFRYGPKTEWMGERAIELAYRERFRSRTSLEERLQRVFAERMRPVQQHMNTLGVRANAIFVAVAVPSEPRTGAQPPAASASVVLQSAEDLFVEILDHQVPVATPLTVRRRLRRYETVSSDPGDPTVELHFDGTVTLGEPLAWAEEGRSGRIAGYDVERAVTRLVATVGARARAEAEPGAYAVRAGVVWFGADLQLAYLRPGSQNQLREVTPAPRITELAPVEASLQGAATVDALREEARELARDLLNQGGLDILNLIPVR